MEILILNRHDFGNDLMNAWKDRLAHAGHHVDTAVYLKTHEKPLSEYETVIAHPIQDDARLLYDEAYRNGNFNLILFNTPSLTYVSADDQFPHKNVHFVGFPSGKDLVRLVEE